MHTNEVQTLFVRLFPAPSGCVHCAHQLHGELEAIVQLVDGAVQSGVGGRGRGSGPVSSEVAGIAVPPQGQDGLSHIFSW